MRLNAGKVLQINVTIDPEEKILEYLGKYLSKLSVVGGQWSEKQIKPLTIVTPNPEQAVLAETDSYFRNIINQADVAIPDGIGLVWGLKVVSDRLSVVGLKRISGVDLMEKLVSIAEKESVRIGLIGGRNGLAVKALECLQSKHPGLEGWGEDGPEVEIKNYELRIKNYESRKSESKRLNKPDMTVHNSLFMLHNSKEDDYFSQIVKKIIDSRTQIVFVGLGAPKQEYFIEAISHWLLAISSNQNAKSQKLIAKSKPIILMSVGGSFDFISGRIKRAPLLIRNIGLEWLWRLFIEPRRWKRQLALVKFVYLVVCQKLAPKSCPCLPAGRLRG